MRRREFIRLFSSTVVAWSLTARAQQSAMPVVGFMISGIQARSQQIAAFHAGLKDTGYVQGQNVTVELRSAEDHFDRYPALAADLLRHGVAGTCCGKQRRGKRRKTSHRNNTDRVRDGR